MIPARAEIVRHETEKTGIFSRPGKEFQAANGLA
jgi:hypothetical protein